MKTEKNQDLAELEDKEAITKEDIFRAAIILASAKEYSVKYVAAVLERIIPTKTAKANANKGSEQLARLIKSAVMENYQPISAVADKIGVSKNTLYGWMQGVTRPAEKNIYKLAEVLDLPRNFFKEDL